MLYAFFIDCIIGSSIIILESWGVTFMHGYSERSELAWTEDSIRIIATPSTFARSALYYVQETGHFQALTSYYTERKGLDSFLIVYTRSGTGTLHYKNKVYALAPNTLFFIDCMEYQYYHSASPENWEILWAHVNGQSIRAYYDQFVDLGEPVITIPGEASIPSFLQRLIELHRNKSIRNELLASTCIVELLTELVLLNFAMEPEEKNPPDYIRASIQQFEKQYNEKKSLTELARQFGINKYHFSKEFKKHTGMSPGEYVINVRITRAKELLKYSDLSIGEITERIGIEYTSHFINLFKARTGLTPLAFRKSWQTLK